MSTLRVDALVAEIGSTTTLVNAFDGLHALPRFLGQGSAPTTVEQGDVLTGLKAALDDLKNNLGTEQLTWEDLFATSSAAGGLRMSVHGLVYDMTVRAAHAAALGAGAVIKMVTAGRMTAGDLEALAQLKPNLILLAGGTDFGERETALFNARAVAALGLDDIPVIYAGNTQNQAEIRQLFKEKGLPLKVCENVYPRLDDLNIEPARKVIQQLFEQHIVKAPGMAQVYDLVTQPLMPTPGAVMEMTRLLHEHMGDLAVLDIGGATTDVHSVCEETEEIARLQTRAGPLFMRTVEGDLGLYVNASHLLEGIGAEKADRELQMDSRAVLQGCGPVPRDDEQRRLMAFLAREAGLTALSRHAGTLRHLYLPGGRQRVAEGKDLTGCRYLVGTGGALTRLPQRRQILEALRDMNRSRKWLFPPPGEMDILVDNDYIMASLGILSRKHPQAALALMDQSFQAESQRTKE